MNTTKRQTTIKTALEKICKESSMDSLMDLAPRVRRARVDDKMLKMLIQEEPISADKLEILEGVVSDLEAAQSPVKMLLTKAASLGHTQVKVAGLMGVSPVTLSRWSSGNFHPTAENLELLMKVVADIESGSKAPA